MTVQMLPEADSVVRQLVPGVLDAAGMHEAADRLRSSGVLTPGDAMSACRLLAEVSELAGDGGPTWSEAVEDAAFWGAAAVTAAHDGDGEAFEYCVGRVTDVLRRAPPSVTVH